MRFQNEMLFLSWGYKYMGISSFQTTEYTIECDECGTRETCHSFYEDVHSKQQAIKWAKMHKTKDGILCDICFKERIKSKQ